jgi:hypothetical protein
MPLCEPLSKTRTTSNRQTSGQQAGTGSQVAVSRRVIMIPTACPVGVSIEWQSAVHALATPVRRPKKLIKRNAERTADPRDDRVLDAGASLLRLR